MSHIQEKFFYVEATELILANYYLLLNCYWLAKIYSEFLLVNERVASTKKIPS